MPLLGLAVVEVQLVMRCLDQGSLLAFARCNRWLFHSCASAEFAWANLAPLRLSLVPATSFAAGNPQDDDSRAEAAWRANRSASRLALLCSVLCCCSCAIDVGSESSRDDDNQIAAGENTAAHLLQHSLLRHCPLALTWLPPESLRSSSRSRLRVGEPPPLVRASELTELASFERLVSLDTRPRSARVRSKDMMLLLSQPNMARLQALYLGECELGAQALETIVLQVPLLRTLQLGTPAFIAAPGFLAPLARLQHLTDLSVSDWAEHESGVAFVAQCAHLRRLTIAQAFSLKPWLSVLSSSPYLSRTLEDLGFEHVYARHGRGREAAPESLSEELRTAFKNIRHTLHTLRLRECFGVDEVLRTMASLGDGEEAAGSGPPLRMERLQRVLIGSGSGGGSSSSTGGGAASHDFDAERLEATELSHGSWLPSASVLNDFLQKNAAETSDLCVSLLASATPHWQRIYSRMVALTHADDDDGGGDDQSQDDDKQHRRRHRRRHVRVCSAAEAAEEWEAIETD
jgi:hypothetical protein